MRDPPPSADMARLDGFLAFRPAQLRARAAALATEHALLGVASAAAAAMVVLLLSGVEGAPLLVRPTMIAVALLAVLGGGWTALARRLQVGGVGASGQPMTLGGRRLIVAGGLLVLASVWTALAGQDATVAAWMTLPIALVVQGVLGIRAVAALGRPATSLASIGLPIAHATLTGGAAVMLIGMLTGTLEAATVYRIGAGTAAVACATVLWNGWLLVRARQRLAEQRRAGVRLPVAERGLRLVLIATLLGLFAPAATLAAMLLLARAEWLPLTCAALIASHHALRYAWVLAEGGLAVRGVGPGTPASAAGD